MKCGVKYTSIFFLCRTNNDWTVTRADDVNTKDGFCKTNNLCTQ